MTHIKRLAAAGLFAAAGLACAEGSWSVIPVPALFYMPETSLGFGVFGLGTWKPEEEGRKPHVVQGGAFYTLKNQVSLFAGSETYLAGDRARIATNLAFSLFPDVYYGLGPDADAEEDYTARQTRLAVSAGWRVAPRLYVGPVYRFARSSLVDTEAGGELATADIDGSEDFTSSGGGLQALWDSRDSPVYPRRGRLIVLEASGFPGALGSTADWGGILLDARSYHRLLESHVIALQALAALTAGEVPFLEMPRVGGQSLLRGYYDGRYRDKVLVALQAEYRFPIVWRLGGVVFGGVGQVAPAVADLSLKDPKVAGGAGLRFLLEEAQHVNLRVDFGLSLEQNGFYLQITEAF